MFIYYTHKNEPDLIFFQGCSNGPHSNVKPVVCEEPKSEQSIEEEVISLTVIFAMMIMVILVTIQKRLLVRWWTNLCFASCKSGSPPEVLGQISLSLFPLLFAQMLILPAPPPMSVNMSCSVLLE